MASNERVRRVAEQIRRDLVAILPDVIRHEKINFVSITGLDLSRDFKYATVHFTVIGDEALQQTMVTLLNEKQGQIRHQLAQQLMTRTVPLMTFKYDESIAYGARMESLLSDLVKDDNDGDDGNNGNGNDNQ